MTIQIQNPVWGFDSPGTGQPQKRVNSATQGWTYQAQCMGADGVTPVAANIDLLVRNVPGGAWAVAANIVLPAANSQPSEVFLSSAIWSEHNVRVNSQAAGSKVQVAGMGIGELA